VPHIIIYLSTLRRSNQADHHFFRTTKNRDENNRKTYAQLKENNPRLPVKIISTIAAIRLLSMTPNTTIIVCASGFSSSILAGTLPTIYPIIACEKLLTPKEVVEKTSSIKPMEKPTLHPVPEPRNNPIKTINIIPKKENLENTISKKINIIALVK